MFTKIKKYLTAFIASAVMISCAGCTTGTSTAVTMSVDGFELKSGVYIYYQYSALEEAKSLALEANPDIDKNDQSALEETIIKDKKFLDWVNEKTKASCSEHIAIIQKFDEMGLVLSEEDIASAKDYTEYIYENESNMYLANGIGEESFNEILLNTYKASEIFDAIYGEGGSENIQESTLKENYISNNVRVKYITIDLYDTEGNELDEAGKTEVKNLANKYLTTVKSAKNDKELSEKFFEVKDEYDAYKEEKSAETTDEEATTEAVTTAPTETTETTTTTTTNPYANESIIQLVTTDENTKEEDITYSPSKALYDWAYNPATKLGAPELIEDEGKIYIAVKLDIEERMTDDDLWTENAVNGQRFTMFSDDMQDKIDEWVAGLRIIINEDAVDRYEPFEFEEPETADNGNNAAY